MKPAILSILLMFAIISPALAQSPGLSSWSYVTGVWKDIFNYDGYRFEVKPSATVRNNTGFIGSYQEIEMETGAGYYELVLSISQNGIIKADLTKNAKYVKTPLVKLISGEAYLFEVVCSGGVIHFKLLDSGSVTLWSYSDQLTNNYCIKPVVPGSDYPMRVSSEVFWDPSLLSDSTDWELSTFFTLLSVYNATENRWYLVPQEVPVKIQPGYKSYIDGSNTKYRGYNIVKGSGATLTAYTIFPDPMSPKASIAVTNIKGYGVAVAGGLLAAALYLIRRGG